MQVIIEGFEAEEEQIGFDVEIFRRDVELKLRLAGIKVLSEEERLDLPGSPWLYLNVNPLHKDRNNNAFAVELSLRQTVRLVRNDSIIFGAATWSTGGVGYGGVSFIRDFVKDHVDTFVNDWLSVNPK